MKNTNAAICPICKGSGTDSTGLIRCSCQKGEKMARIGMNKSEMRILEIKDKFNLHIASPDGVQKMKAICRHTRSLALAIEILCPEGQSKERAISGLVNVMYSANHAIAEMHSMQTILTE